MESDGTGVLAIADTPGDSGGKLRTSVFKSTDNALYRASVRL